MPYSYVSLVSSSIGPLTIGGYLDLTESIIHTNVSHLNCANSNEDLSVDCTWKTLPIPLEHAHLAIPLGDAFAHELCGSDCPKICMRNAESGCSFDESLFGKPNNYYGDFCEECKDKFYPNPSKSKEAGCAPCDCNTDGSTNLICNQRGQCPCKDNVIGTKCDTCAPTFYNLNQGGCVPCDHCDESGSIKDKKCHPKTGECLCKQNVQGDNCGECKDYYWNLDSSNDYGCESCDCSQFGSKDKPCNKTSGVCECFENYSGNECYKCKEGYYDYPLCESRLESYNLTRPTKCSAKCGMGKKLKSTLKCKKRFIRYVKHCQPIEDKQLECVAILTNSPEDCEAEVSGECDDEANLGSWGEWSDCSESCLKTLDKIPTRTRKRRQFSSDQDWQEEIQECDVPMCPIEGHCPGYYIHLSKDKNDPSGPKMCAEISINKSEVS